MWTDGLGNLATLHEGERSAAALGNFVEGFIASEARAADILQVADTDTSPLIQACAAAVHLFAESPAGPTGARPFLDRAQAGAARCTDREQRFIAAIAAWAAGDIPRAVSLHEEQARLHPRDLAAVKLGQYHLFNRGDSPGMLRLALAALPAAADVPYLHGMLAFGWEQCHALEAAEAAARRAIGMRRKEPWAHHALAHVMLTQGRIAEGRAFLADVSGTWTGLNSFMLTHNWWHQALFAIEQGDGREALELYDTRVWGVAMDYSQDQVNAVSLLARLELAEVDVGLRWQALADHLARRTRDQVLPFLDLQYLYGLARAGRTQADALMRNLEAKAADDRAEPVWREVALPAAAGLLAHARGDWAMAARQLGIALPGLARIGGSHAQRELFDQMQLDALVRSGQFGAAQNLLQPRCRALPESVRLRRQAQALYASLGLGSATANFFWS